MTNSAYSNPTSSWDFDFWAPQPRQDSDLLKQLGFLPGLKEILMLRQVHALEHATVWVLSEMPQSQPYPENGGTRQLDNEALGGLSTDQGFYLYGQVNQLDLQRSVSQALQRFQQGEWNLALHPRCGTNLSVTMLLTVGLALGAHILFPRGPIEQLIGLGLAATTAAQLAPDVGMSTQKYFTTAIPFNLELTDISTTKDFWGRSAYFVRVRWRELQ